MGEMARERSVGRDRIEKTKVGDVVYKVCLDSCSSLLSLTTFLNHALFACSSRTSPILAWNILMIWKPALRRFLVSMLRL